MRHSRNNDKNTCTRLNERPRWGLIACGAVAVTLAAPAAFAGFTAVTKIDPIVYVNSAGGAGFFDIGDMWEHAHAGTNTGACPTPQGGYGGFAFYKPDSSNCDNDPQIDSGSLTLFRYRFDNMTITSVVGTVVTYSGSYFTYFDLNGNNCYDGADLTCNPMGARPVLAPDPRVSSGTASLTAVWNASFTIASVSGTLMQTNGPENPCISDPGYSFNGVPSPIDFAGSLEVDPMDASMGRVQGSLRQNAATYPETGACCMPDGTCEVVDLEDEGLTNYGCPFGCPDRPGLIGCFAIQKCNEEGGTYLGDVVNDPAADEGDPTDPAHPCASPNPCAQPGACCFPDGSCAQALVIGAPGGPCMSADPTMGVGTYQGNGTTCATANCPQPPAGQLSLECPGPMDVTCTPLNVGQGQSTCRSGNLNPECCQVDAFPNVDGYQFVVQVWMRNLTTPACGFEAYIRYNDTLLDFRADLSCYTNNPFQAHPQAPLGTGSPQADDGEVELSGANANIPQVCTDDDAHLASLVFTAPSAGFCTKTDFFIEPVFGDRDVISNDDRNNDDVIDEPDGNPNRNSTLADANSEIPTTRCDVSLTVTGTGPEVVKCPADIEVDATEEDCTAILEPSPTAVVISGGAEVTVITARPEHGQVLCLTQNPVQHISSSVTWVPSHCPIDNPDPECAGQTCATFTDCNPADPLGDCVCVSLAGGGGACVHGTTQCAGLVPCPGGQGDCPPGFLCAVDTCCGVPLCVPPTALCASPTPEAAPLPPGTLTISGVVGADGYVPGHGPNDGGIAGPPPPPPPCPDDCCTMATLEVLATDYKVLDPNNCWGCGSPRFEILVDTDGDPLTPPCTVNVYFSPSGHPMDCPPPDMWFNTGNFVTDLALRWDSSDCGGLAAGTYADAVAATGPCGIIESISIVTGEDPACPAPHTLYVDNWDITCGGKGETIDFDRTAIFTSGGPECLPPTIECTRSDGLNLNDPYPPGVTTICCVATDECGSEVECCFTVTVTAADKVEVCVQLPASTGPQPAGTTYSRCIRFTTYADDGFGGCGPEIDCEEISVNFTSRQLAQALVNYSIGCASGAAFVCAKDEQHTLSGMVEVDDSDGDGILESKECLVLRPGDTNDDDEVDIQDVTFTFSRFGMADPPITCTAACEDDITTGPNPLRGADFTNNGTVDGQDVSALNPNFGTNGDCTCALPLPEGAGKFVRTSIMTRDLAADVAAKVDLDRDGVVDHRDIRALETKYGLDHSLSDKIAQIARQQRTR